MYIHILIIFLLIIIVVYFICSDDLVEHYNDVIPDKLRWNIFKCYTPECIKNESHKCFSWCQNITSLNKNLELRSDVSSEDGENCRTTCLDYADEQFAELNVQGYIWNYL